MTATSSNTSLRRFRLILWVLVAVAAIGATMVFFLAPPKGASTIGQGSFSLVDQDGAAVSETTFQGHPSLLFFGYTHCPDVCPTTMGEMQSWFATLGEGARDLKAYFVSVDPERDTPAVLKDYVGWLDGKLIGLTGTRAQVDEVTRLWGVVAEKVAGDGADYTMNHTASVFLLDRNGRFQSTIAYGENPDTAVAKIRKLIGA